MYLDCMMQCSSVWDGQTDTGKFQGWNQTPKRASLSRTYVREYWKGYKPPEQTYVFDMFCKMVKKGKYIWHFQVLTTCCRRAFLSRSKLLLILSHFKACIQVEVAWIEFFLLSGGQWEPWVNKGKDQWEMANVWYLGPALHVFYMCWVSPQQPGYVTWSYWHFTSQKETLQWTQVKN